MLLAIPLAVILAGIVAYGMLFQTRSVGGGFVGWLTSQIKDTFLGFEWIAKLTVDLTKWLAHSLGSHFMQIEGAVVAWFVGWIHHLEFMAASTFAIAYDLERFASWLIGTYIPKAIRNLPSSITHAVHTITTRVVHVERTIVKLPGLTKAQVRAAVAVAIPGLIARELPYFDWLKKHLKALERVIAGGTIAVVGGAIHLPKELVSLRKRIARLEKVGLGTIAAGAVALALARLGVTWIRCNNWKRLGRAGCNLDSNSITQLLGLVGGLALIQGNFSIVTLAEEMLAIEEQMVGVVKGAFKELDGIAA